MRPKICVPIVAVVRDAIVERAREISALPVQMVEWRVDFFAGYERELPDTVRELKQLLPEKELIVTLRTQQEGGEPNGSRFDYFYFLESILKEGCADYVDAEIERGPDRIAGLKERYRDSGTKIIGSYHDFQGTPEGSFIVQQLKKAKNCGCDVGKFACMPRCPEDVKVLLEATARMKEEEPEYPLITMSMGELGVASRLYGGLYGSEVSFGCAGESSAPGQIPWGEVKRVHDRIYSGKKHIILIGFMGVGKSTVSRELFRKSGRPEIDTDHWIEEREGRSISRIFEEEGEEYFRDRETELIDELGEREPSVVSCGGGMILRDLNVRKLKALGEIVLLTASPESIYERVKDSTSRPLLNGNMNTDYIAGLMEQRRPYYEAAKTVSVSTDDREISDIAKEILEKCQ